MNERLTPRELEVALLIAEYLTFDEIADRLGITARTVRAHADRARQKLYVDRSRDIPKALKKLGLLEGE